MSETSIVRYVFVNFLILWTGLDQVLWNKVIVELIRNSLRKPDLQIMMMEDQGLQFLIILANVFSMQSARFGVLTAVAM
jgi:hypothetical protein